MSPYRAPTTSGPEPRQIDIVVADGLQAFAQAELRRVARGAPLNEIAPGVFTLRYQGDLRALLDLRTVTSVALLRRFQVPRPKALLGDEHLRAAIDLIEQVLRLHPAGTFQSLYLSAAGADSPVLTRLKTTLAERLGLQIGSDDGDLLLRLRRSADGAGWELLVRLSPRPLATRAWRVCNLEGALNGPLAYTVALLSGGDPQDTFLNIGCGSGSILIERLLGGPARRAIGCDISGVALDCARANVAAAGLENRCELQQWDATKLPLADASISALAADLPFGHLVGSHNHNLTLYPALLREAARVARPGAQFAALSHEIRFMERLLTNNPDWDLIEQWRIDQGGLHPRIFVLERRGTPGSR